MSALILYTVGDQQLDLLDLKVSILNRGICVDEAVYDQFEGKVQLSRSPYSCNTLLLDGELPCFLARYNDTPFRLTLNNEQLVITYLDEEVVPVSLPHRTSFYEQKTSHGIPFGNLGVIQGRDMLAFSCLWRCEITRSGNACGFCHTGKVAVPEHSLSDMMEVIRYAVEEDPQTHILQMTAGSTFHPEKEIDRYVDILQAIDKEIGIAKVPTIIYLTPPKDLSQLDRLFEAGVGQIACDMDIWDKNLFERICPGKAKINTRERYLDALRYIAEKYGPNRACCVFVAGLEPLDSLLEGERYLAERGIVPLPSPLMPFGIKQKILSQIEPFSIGYYRTLRRETAKLYNEHRLIVPGTFGSAVCLSRDIWLRRDILAVE